MLDLFTTPDLRPFFVLSGFSVVLILFFVIQMLLGIGLDVGADSDADLDFGMDGVLDPGVEPAVLDGLSPDEIHLLDVPSVDNSAKLSQAERIRRPLRLIGIGLVPLTGWLALAGNSVAAAGLLLQSAMEAITGGYLPVSIAMAIALLPGLRLCGLLSSWLSRLIPSYESEGVSDLAYNGRRGSVTIGAARRNYPAEVRWTDAYGGRHQLMAEPLRDDETIGAGTEVLILKTKDRQPRLIAIG